MDDKGKKREIDAVDNASAAPDAQRQRTGELTVNSDGEDWTSRNYVPVGLIKRPDTENVPRMWCVLKSDYTGDQWHCLAAEILWEYQRDPGDLRYVPPVFDHHRISIGLLIWGYNERNAKTKNELVIPKRARNPYNYAKSIGARPPILTADQPPKGQRYSNQMPNHATGSGLTSSNRIKIY